MNKKLNFFSILSNKNCNQYLNQKGLTLIEILAVITLIGIIMTVVVTQIGARLSEGKVETTKIQMSQIMSTLEDFKRHCNRYPTTEEGLNALITKPAGGPECKRYRPGGYFEKGAIPVDSFDNPFTYESPDNGRTFVIKSMGEDRIEGGEGYDADLSSKDL